MKFTLESSRHKYLYFLPLKGISVFCFKNASILTTTLIYFAPIYFLFLCVFYPFFHLLDLIVEKVKKGKVLPYIEGSSTMNEHNLLLFKDLVKINDMLKGLTTQRRFINLYKETISYDFTNIVKMEDEDCTAILNSDTYKDISKIAGLGFKYNHYRNYIKPEIVIKCKADLIDYYQENWDSSCKQINSEYSYKKYKSDNRAFNNYFKNNFELIPINYLFTKDIAEKDYFKKIEDVLKYYENLNFLPVGAACDVIEVNQESKPYLIPEATFKNDIINRLLNINQNLRISKFCIILFSTAILLSFNFYTGNFNFLQILERQWFSRKIIFDINLLSLLFYKITDF